ncbi:ROK family protein [Actinorugispora endophytica]|uniref:Putative NBD/HSP70 family sugar kinase n=1 Tax=Actinorugispora endophytica TaxID=1605990 RepID=A0A4R6UXM7_9ACTN|nr:ROK family protein [Actinorugispora endophytica]TDQ50769.1 putative NBD/HSP70 family sugar kinase [Actinorugispora endophytica]
MIGNSRDPNKADVADVRATNLAVVLRCVRERSPCSRADVAAATGLNKTTVSSLVSELLRRRLLRETGTTGNRVGRPAVMLTLDGASCAAIGIEVGADSLTAVAVDLAGRPVLSWRRAFPGAASSPPRAVTAVAALARRVITRTERDGRQVLGLAVALPGLVDADGRARLVPSLGWRDVDFAAGLVDALRGPGFPVEIGNDADFAVLAEHRFGPHAGTADLVYLTGGVGLGAGLLLDGALRRGHTGHSGEAGRIRVPAAEGDARLEELASAAAVVRRASPGEPADDARPSRAELELRIGEVVARARAGDPATLSGLAAAARDLAAGVAVLVDVLDPRRVVLGGYYADLAPWLLPVVNGELAGRAIAPDPGEPIAVASALGLDAPALGAAARILDAVESGRLPDGGAPPAPAAERAVPRYR